jgi:hypothetical protein
MPTLVLTIQGPFAYVPNYPVLGLITLMAPMCSQHKGGISGIGKGCEFLFRGNCCNQGTSFAESSAFEYALGLNVGSSDNPVWKKEGSVLSIPRNGKKFDSSDWRFWIIMPMPDIFVTVNPVDARIKATGSVADPPYSVGMRFIYKQWDGKDMPISLNGKPAPAPGGGYAVFHFGDLGEDQRWDLEIEYAGAARDDLDHEDAVECFETLMTTLGYPEWSIGFPITQADVTHRNDCKAAISWVE